MSKGREAGRAWGTEAGAVQLQHYLCVFGSEDGWIGVERDVRRAAYTWACL